MLGSVIFWHFGPVADSVSSCVSRAWCPGDAHMGERHGTYQFEANVTVHGHVDRSKTFTESRAATSVPGQETKPSNRADLDAWEGR